jgi:hypothetical protein
MSMNQPLPIAGYRPQSDERVGMVNANKDMEERLLRLLDDGLKMGLLDQRWAAIARTDLEKGFMAFNRAIFQPSRISLPGD